MARSLARRKALAATTLLTLLASSSAAWADPQFNASLVTGVCGTGTHDSWWSDTCWFNGLRGDVMFGRNRNSDLGIGPYLDATTAGFDDVRLGGGLTGILPVHPYYPIVVSAGTYARHGDFGWEPGVAGWLFWGSRSYNFHSNYVLSAGLLAGVHYGLGDSKETAIIIGAQIDLLPLSFPFIILYEALRGPSDE